MSVFSELDCCACLVGVPGGHLERGLLAVKAGQGLVVLLPGHGPGADGVTDAAPLGVLLPPSEQGGPRVGVGVPADDERHVLTGHPCCGGVFEGVRDSVLSGIRRVVVDDGHGAISFATSSSVTGGLAILLPHDVRTWFASFCASAAAASSSSPPRYRTSVGSPPCGISAGRTVPRRCSPRYLNFMTEPPRTAGGR